MSWSPGTGFFLYLPQLNHLCGVKRKKKNILVEKVLVENYAAEGKSLARVDGKVIFIEDAVPGDVVDVRLSKSKKDWAEGRAVHFHSFAKERVVPFCEHFGVCGGCQWQMLPYEKQLQYKESQVIETLKRIGKIELKGLEPILGTMTDRRYRNKMEYTFGNKRFLLPSELKNEDISPLDNVAGFHAKGIFDKVVDIKTCHLQEEPTNRIRIAIKEFALSKGYSFYDIREHKGFMRTVQLRICRSGEIMVNIVVGEPDQDKINVLMEFISASFPEITTLLYTVNRKMNDSLYDQEPIIYNGNGYVIETLEDFKFKVGPKSFFQTNTMQAERLYQVTREFAALSGNEVVYDLYCGTGSIGIFLSKQAKSIVGVELIPEAIADAKENAALNSITQTAFYTGDVTELCDDAFFEANGRPDVIITDPPRAGMTEKLVRKINEMEAPVIVYVSCNPATQARDLQWLSEKYEVDRIRPVDMFPHTHHIENVVRLVLKKSISS